MYENSRFLKNRFTFCGVNTNFGQQWAPPAYYHLTPIVSKGKHCDVFRFPVVFHITASVEERIHQQTMDRMHLAGEDEEDEYGGFNDYNATLDIDVSQSSRWVSARKT